MDKTKPLISVIVPVYNVQKFLHKCLNSIANQTLKNIEVIIVNDGSTDFSKNIIDEYVSKHDNFKVINKMNEGVPAARNLGIKESNGKYIVFIDSDDYVDKDFLKYLYYTAEKNKSDIACCNYYQYNMETNKKYIYPFAMKQGVYSNRVALKTLINDNKLQYYIWNKIFLRSLIVKNNISFPDFCFEDTEFSVKAFYYANKIAVIEKPLYYYCKHEGSAIAQIGIDKINDYLFALASTRKFLEKKQDFTYYRHSYFTHSIRIYGSTIMLILKAQGVNSKSIKNLIRAEKAIKYYNSKKFKPTNDKISTSRIIKD